MTDEPVDPSGQATVVLEIGGSIGALVVYAPDDWFGHELEITGIDDAVSHFHTHTLVRPRHLPGGVMHAAVFPDLTGGRYRLDGHGSHPTQDITIAGGEVTELDWR